MELSVKIGRVMLKNPVAVASGTFGYGEEMKDLVRLSALGAIFTKAVTLQPRQGNPPPRIVETPSGMLNAIGLANVGVEAFVRDKLPFLRQCGARIFVNVAGSTIPEYEAVVRRLNRAKGIDGYEINVSCPNVKKGGITFSSSPVEMARVVRALRKATARTLVIKLSPNVTDIAAYARAAEGEGADAVSLINTLIGMAIDIRTRKPRLTNVTGGLSGPAVRPVGVAMVYKAARAVRIPVIGMGGIVSAQDALEYLIAGAAAVQVGTGNFIDPATPGRVLLGVREYMKKNRIRRIKDLTGSLITL
ncbi:MAG: dihydroorotate dehydrogenase [Fibrobacterota bacterium]